METSPLPTRAGSGPIAMNKILYPGSAALMLAGCMSGTSAMKLSESHPANPAAAQAAYPPLAPFLMADTNLVVMMTTTSTNAPEKGHEGHPNGKPEAKTPQKHDHN